MFQRLALAAALILAALPLRAEIEIQEVTSPGGIDAWLVTEPSIPFVALEIRMRGGANLDPEGKRGAAYLMTGLLEEGAGDMDAQAFQTAREGLAASFGFNVYDDTMSISAEFLTENADQAVDLLRLALVEPRFDADAIERVRGQVIAIIEQDLFDPQSIASARLSDMAYPGHPYGSAYEGTVDSVTALTRDDLVAAHRAVVTRNELYVAAVGDITAEELGPMLDRLLGDLPVDAPERPPAVDYALPGGITVVDFPSPQSVALFGHGGIPRDDPDFIPASVLNHILGGGGFESRLMQEVREKRGLTYGIGTFLVPQDLSAMYLGSFASSNATIAEAIEVIRAQWADIAANGVTQAELDAALTFMTGEYPLRFDGNAEIAGIMVGMQMVGLPPDYVINRNDLVRAVTLDDIRRIAGRLLQPDNLHFVVVGQPEGLTEAAESP